MSHNIGITGQNGFIGTHLYNTLWLEPDKYHIIPFERSFFEANSRLEEFVSQCDVIVHLAALNRHNDSQIIYDTNLYLVKRLIQAMESTHSKPHLLFASSIQEERDNPYGQSKKEGRILLKQWGNPKPGPFYWFDHAQRVRPIRPPLLQLRGGNFLSSTDP